MPRSLKYKLGLSTIATLFLVPTILAFSARWSFTAQQPAHHGTVRDVAASLKVERLSGKQLSALTVQLPALDVVPEYDREDVKITGYITANVTDGSVVRYQWDLPQGVEVVSGDTGGSLTDMVSGDTYEVEIVVSGFSREVGKHIRLGAKVKRGDDEFVHTAMIASRPEDSLEYVAADLHKYAQASRPKEFKSGRVVK